MKNMTEKLNLESNLEEMLSPVAPSNDFINNLQESLQSKAQVIVESPNHFIPIVLVSVGLFIGIASVWGLNRIFRLISPRDRKK